MSAKFSLYAGEPIERLLAHDPGLTRSGRLNGAIDAYLAIVEAELARAPFTKGEWCAIFDANNGAGIGHIGDDDGWRFMWANVADSPELDEKWNVDRHALVEKMRALSDAGKLAVAEACGRFWARCDRPTDEALAAAGIAAPGG